VSGKVLTQHASEPAKTGIFAVANDRHKKISPILTESFIVVLDHIQTLRF